MQRDESCSTFILTTQVLPIHKKSAPQSESYTSVLIRTCFGTDADLTAALRKSLPADSPSATIVTAFVVIFRRKSGARNAGEREQANFTARWRRAAVSQHRTLSSSSFPVSSKSVHVPSGADTCDKRGQDGVAAAGA